MKVGLLLECGRDGAELKSMPHLVRHIGGGITLDPIPLDSKRKLIRECGQWSAECLGPRGCQRVVIVWDAYPAWPSMEDGHCLWQERQDIFTSLGNAGVDLTRVHLVCIHSMFEAWLLADERALSSLLSTAEHPIAVSRCKRPEQGKDAKGQLNSIFSKSGGRFRQYVDRDHAHQIAQEIGDLARLSRLKSFSRFQAKLQ